MRIALALLLACGVALTVRADDPPQPATSPSAAPPPVAAPATPKAIPVPTGDVVKRTELEKGLIAEDLKIGDGEEIKEGWTVTALYHGTLKADGKMFDSAFERGAPITFPLTNVIPGWQKGVPGMKVGGIRRLTIPAELAYGANPPTPSIPPNSDLVFVIQVTEAWNPKPQIEDLKVGTGDETASGQCVAVTRHVMKTEDGKEVEKYEGDKLYIWFPGENSGMVTAFEGMKVGGKRRVKLSGHINTSPPQLETTRPQNVPLVVELELVAFRNIPTGQPRH